MYLQVYSFYPALKTAILPRIPPTHIILSMASFTAGIQRQAVNSRSSIISLLNLREESSRIFAILKDHERVFSGASAELVKLMRER